jgi:hypothetical protein
MLITINDPVSGQRIVLSTERKIASVIKIRGGKPPCLVTMLGFGQKDAVATCATEVGGARGGLSLGLKMALG